MAVNKVVYGGETIVDLTADTVTPETLAEGVTAHDKAGNAIVGAMVGGGGASVETCTVDVFDPDNICSFIDYTTCVDGVLSMVEKDMPTTGFTTISDVVVGTMLRVQQRLGNNADVETTGNLEYVITGSAVRPFHLFIAGSGSCTICKAGLELD